MGKFTCTDAQTLDGQAGMSMQADRPECEYRRRLREHEVRSNRLSCVVVRRVSGACRFIIQMVNFIWGMK